MKKILAIAIATFLLIFGNISIGHAANIVFDLSTNQTTYKQGDTITIEGKITVDGKPGTTTKPVVKLLKGSELVQIKQWESDEINKDGSISGQIKLYKNIAEGKYTLVGYATSQKSNEINIVIGKGDGSGNGDGGGTTTPPGSGGGGTPGTPIPDPGKPDPEPTAPAQPQVNAVTFESNEITGKAEKGAKVIITDKKDFTVETKASLSDGTFTIKLHSKLEAGTVLYATSVNEVTNMVSEEVKITVLGKTLPTVSKVNAFTSNSTKITGKATPGSKVYVKVGKKITTGTVNSKGDFSVTIGKKKTNTTIYVYVKDKDGNTSKSVKVTVLDKTPPAKPKVNKVTKSSTKVTGKAEAHAKVYVKIGKKVVTGTVSSKGNFSVKISKQKAKTTIYVYAKDKAGNASKTTKVIVK